MAEATQYLFSFKELASLMVKKQDLHEGLWAIYVKFGISAANVSLGGGDLMPTAMIPILEIGIQKQDQPSSLTVDAAEVNPSSKKAKKKTAKKG
jgi:hypothetical protein